MNPFFYRLTFLLELDTDIYKLFQVQVTISRGGQQMGPYTVDQINDYLAQGSLLPTDYAWHEGLPDWVPVTQISGVGHAVTHVEYVNGKPKTVRAFTGKLLLFWIVGSIISTPVFFLLLNLIGLGPTDGSTSEILKFSGVVSVLMIIFCLGVSLERVDLAVM